MSELHTALRSEVLDRLNASGLEMQLVRLQHGKDTYSLTLHAKPTSFTSAGIQTTDLLAYLGFSAGRCVFLRGDCYAREVADGMTLSGFGSSFRRYQELMEQAGRNLERCGYDLPQPEGWSYFFGSGGGEGRIHIVASGDGHRASEQKRMKEAEDSQFQYVFTWISGGDDKGWVTHYRPKNDAAAAMLQRFRGLFPMVRTFQQCPEFAFEPCAWRFESFERDDSAWRDNAHWTHGHFDAHAEAFASGLAALLAADAVAEELGMSERASRRASGVPPGRTSDHRPQVSSSSTPGLDKRAVFLSHAGEDRGAVLEELCAALDRAGITYWYSEAEINWGESLVQGINRGFAISDYVVVILSRHFIGKPWPERELNSALSIESSTGQVKVLPLVVGDDRDIEQILGAYPLLADKKYQRWTGDGSTVVEALRRLLSKS
jgi:hypothetical protein